MFILVTKHSRNGDLSTHLVNSKESCGYAPLKLCFETREEAEKYLEDNKYYYPCEILEMAVYKRQP